ncbi:collagen binding domain-containing protein [Lactococcus lactis]|uniref:collagen binding domain-containing protein n=1 Tax=Lactococcus lactis TaxID=1358 RepID=UPI0028806DF1|nr:collagen binding domain-containing protein [Lactococcus lactis]
MNLSKDITFEIKDEAGNIIGTAVANHLTGVVTVTFSKLVENATSDIKGSFSVWVNWDEQKVEENTRVVVDWKDGGTTEVNIGPATGPDKDEVLYKWGWVDENDSTLIHWQVRINYAKENIQKAIYTDIIGGNQNLVSGSISVANVTYSSDGENYNVDSYYPQASILENGVNGFTVNLGDISNTIIVDYSTKATDGGLSQQYENRGELTGENIEKQVVEVHTPNNGGNGNASMKLSISGEKTWIDENNARGLRPSFISIELYRNGEKVDSRDVTAKENWKYSFTDLDKYDESGKLYDYDVKEVPVSNYTSQQEGYNFINTIIPVKEETPEKPDLSITTPSSSSQVMSVSSSSMESEPSEELPKTGDSPRDFFKVLGILLLISGGLGMIYIRRKSKI